MMTAAELLERARQHRQRRQWPEAELVCRQIVEAESEHADAWFELGAACQEQNKLHEAVACCRSAVELYPGNGQWLARLAALLLEQGGVSAALGRLKDWAPMFVHLAHELARCSDPSVQRPLLAEI